MPNETFTVEQSPAGRGVAAGGGWDDDEMLARLRAGDPRAQEAFVRGHISRMLSVARRYLPCPQDADDAVQDAFISAFRAIPSFKAGSSLATWLHRIVVNACLMKLRSEARHAAASESVEAYLPAFDPTGHHAHRIAPWCDAGGLGSPEARAMSAETKVRVHEAIDRLPPTYRTVLLLRDIEEMDTAEAAEVLGCTRANVKTRLHRARQALRTHLEPLFREQLAESKASSAACEAAAIACTG
jgi:RNA polymerase sigma-70 factor (ECF subfamily)